MNRSQPSLLPPCAPLDALYEPEGSPRCTVVQMATHHSPVARSPTTHSVIIVDPTIDDPSDDEVSSQNSSVSGIVANSAKDLLRERRLRQQRSQSTPSHSGDVISPARSPHATVFNVTPNFFSPDQSMVTDQKAPKSDDDVEEINLSGIFGRPPTISPTASLQRQSLSALDDGDPLRDSISEASTSSSSGSSGGNLGPITTLGLKIMEPTAGVKKLHQSIASVPSSRQSQLLGSFNDRVANNSCSSSPRNASLCGGGGGIDDDDDPLGFGSFNNGGSISSLMPSLTVPITAPALTNAIPIKKQSLTNPLSMDDDEESFDESTELTPIVVQPEVVAVGDFELCSDCEEDEEEEDDVSPLGMPHPVLIGSLEEGRGHTNMAPIAGIPVVPYDDDEDDNPLSVGSPPAVLSPKNTSQQGLTIGNRSPQENNISSSSVLCTPSSLHRTRSMEGHPLSPNVQGCLKKSKSPGDITPPTEGPPPPTTSTVRQNSCATQQEDETVARNGDSPSYSVVEVPRIAMGLPTIYEAKADYEDDDEDDMHHPLGRAWTMPTPPAGSRLEALCGGGNRGHVHPPGGTASSNEGVIEVRPLSVSPPHSSGEMAQSLPLAFDKTRLPHTANVHAVPNCGGGGGASSRMPPRRVAHNAFSTHRRPSGSDDPVVEVPNLGGQRDGPSAHPLGHVLNDDGATFVDDDDQMAILHSSASSHTTSGSTCGMSSTALPSASHARSISPSALHIVRHPPKR